MTRSGGPIGTRDLKLRTIFQINFEVSKLFEIAPIFLRVVICLPTDIMFT